MECESCNEKLEWHDWFGKNMKFNGGGDKTGDIYKCHNEECDYYNQAFHTRNSGGGLIEGMPC